MKPEKVQPGDYIVIEGTDGAGKTTQRDILAQHFANQFEVVVISEPGGTPIGDEIRRVIKDGELARTAESNFDMFTICRREIARQVLPALAVRDCVAISDRNWFSSVAYQGFGEGLDVDKLLERSEEALGEYFRPSHAVILDLPPHAIRNRLLLRRGVDNDYFDSKGIDFFDRVSKGYSWLAKEYDIPVINATQSVDDVHAEILEKL